MAGANRILGACAALRSDLSCQPLISGSSMKKRGMPHSHHQTKKTTTVAVSIEDAVVVSPQDQRKQTAGGIIELSSSLARATSKLISPSRAPTTAARTCWRLQAEMLIERGIVGCGSFVLIAVAGSLIGSILCFVEGCFLVVESYLHYFHSMASSSHNSDVVQLLVEAVDMFLVGTALLTFGMGLYVMFAGSKRMAFTRHITQSNKFGLFNLKRLSDSMEIRSVAHAKSKLGHAVVLILQSAAVDKFKNVPLATSLDLACFAAAVLVASASVFLLSRLALHQTKATCI